MVKKKIPYLNAILRPLSPCGCSRHITTCQYFQKYWHLVFLRDIVSLFELGAVELSVKVSQLSGSNTTAELVALISFTVKVLSYVVLMSDTLGVKVAAVKDFITTLVLVASFPASESHIMQKK